MTYEQFNKAEKLLIKIADIKSTILSIRHYQSKVKKDNTIDAFMLIHCFNKKFRINIGESKEDDKALISALKKKMKNLQNEFKNL